ncbi:NUDIX hydrolase [Hydrocarboniphaga effusa]|uniref:NUDIX hydrolase n=1 Tax=Hydrocarboniphaga effusa TaxID=243629 RepID=UPI003BA91628
MPATNPDWMPHIVVATIVEREGRFLLVEERIAGELVLNQPAGHWEPGETLVEGAIRETVEESGWDVEPTAFLGIYEWQPEGLAYPFVRFAFIAGALRHHPERVLDTGIERAVWLTYDEVVQQASRLRSPSVLTCIEDYRAGRRYPLSLIRHVAPR